jgi:hypothetical protein
MDMDMDIIRKLSRQKYKKIINHITENNISIKCLVIKMIGI